MHEYSLVQALLDRVEREARAHHATAVHRISVRLGAASGVEPSLFATAFEMCRNGTLCAGAELTLEHERERWLCDVCSEEIPPGRALVCPSCGWPARLAEGDALRLERIDLEVPHV